MYNNPYSPPTGSETIDLYNSLHDEYIVSTFPAGFHLQFDASKESYNTPYEYFNSVNFNVTSQDGVPAKTYSLGGVATAASSSLLSTSLVATYSPITGGPTSVAASTSTAPTSTYTDSHVYSSSGGLSTGAKVGIGVGVSFGVILIAVLITFAILTHRRVRRIERSTRDDVAQKEARKGASFNSSPEESVFNQYYAREEEAAFAVPQWAEGAPMLELGGSGIARVELQAQEPAGAELHGTAVRFEVE